MVSEKESSESIEEVNVRWAGYRVGLVWNHRAHEFFDNPGLADSRKFFFAVCLEVPQQGKRWAHFVDGKF